MIRAIFSFLVLFAIIYLSLETYLNKVMFKRVKRSQVVAYSALCATIAFAILGAVVYLF